jgi:hypothetical protein
MTATVIQPTPSKKVNAVISILDLKCVIRGHETAARGTYGPVRADSHSGLIPADG